MLLGFPARLNLSTIGEQRFFEVSPDILDRMEMVGLKAGLWIDGFDGFSEALRVIREGRGDMKAAVFASLQKLPGIVPILRRRFMGDQDAVMLVLDAHHTVVRAQRVVAVNVTLGSRADSQSLPRHLLWCGQMCTNVINPAFDRRLGNRNQEQGGKKERNVPETDPAHHRKVASQTDHTVAHMLGG